MIATATQSTLMDWLPTSPTRSPAWRWLRACHLNEHCRPPDSRIDDESVVQALRFLTSKQHSPNLRPQHGSDPADGAIQAALDLWRMDAPHRWRLEGYLLTDESLEMVAQRCSLPLATVDVYARLFFACRECMRATDWIMLRAVGGGPWNYFGAGRLDIIWKAFAYAGGPLALEMVMAVTTNKPLPNWVRAALTTNPAFEETQLRLRLKTLIAAMSAQTPQELKAVEEIHLQAKEIDRRGSTKRRRRDPMSVVTQGIFALASGSKRASKSKKPSVAQKSTDRTTTAAGAMRSRQRPLDQLIQEMGL